MPWMDHKWHTSLNFYQFNQEFPFSSGNSTYKYQTPLSNEKESTNIFFQIGFPPKQFLFLIFKDT